MDFSVVSWNLCGLSKLIRWPSAFEWLETRDVALIQESLQTKSSFNFNNVTRFDIPVVASGGRASGGLVILLRNRVFGNARVRVVLEEQFMLAVEVTTSSQSFIVANVYAPVFTTGYSAEILTTISLQLDVLCQQYPTTPLIIAGTLAGIPSFFSTQSPN
jgi:exonuclease III